ncbi:MAG: hypothetical protein WD875_04625 [Pirellulales bacterium]
MNISFLWPPSRCICTLAIVLAGLPAAAAVETIELPRQLTAFAMHPQTGDLAALATREGQVLLFRGADLAAGKATPAAKTRVGANPTSICYKRFGDTDVFAVVCFRDPHMYLIAAKDRALLRKVPLAQSGATFAMASTNPNDPFVYYCHDDEDRHDATTGVVSLRDMRDKGVVFGGAFGFAVSASGRIAYAVSSWSSGLESLAMSNDLTDDKPAFAQTSYGVDSRMQTVPCPFERYTAVGRFIYTASLSKREAELRLTPLCFFTKHPVLVGIGGGPFGLQSDLKTIEVLAASYNTFNLAGKAIVLDVARPERGKDSDEANDGESSEDEDDYRLARLRDGRPPWFFADDARDRVVVAHDGRLFFVPLADFGLPAEPFLLASLEGPTRLVVGKDYALELKPTDERVAINIDSMPDGMQATGNRLAWRPRGDQVGPAAISVTLKHGGIQRSMTFDLAVAFPSVALPFAPAGVTIRADGKQAVIWEGPAADRQGFILEDTPALGAEYRVAIVDLESGKTLAEKKANEPVYAAVFAGDYIALNTGLGTTRCELLKAADLERAKTLVAAAPVVGVETSGKHLVVHSQAGSELYEMGSFRRLATVESYHWRGANQPTTGIAVTTAGIFMRGMLFDADLKPQLLLQPQELPVLAGADEGWSLGLWPDENADRPRDIYFPGSEGEAMIAEKTTPDGKTKISMTVRTTNLKTPESDFGNRQETEISLSAAGDVNARQTLLREQHTANGNRPLQPILSLVGDDAFVLFDRELYRWPIARASNAAAKPSAPLTFLPRQSALVIAPKDKTVLKHSAEGGQKPYKFAVLTSYDAITIDTETGDVTVDETAILDEAQRAMDNWVIRTSGNQSSVDKLRSLAPSLAARTEQILGRRPKGVPVAIPICVDVTDAASTTRRLQYFVLAECPSGEALARLGKRDGAKPKRNGEQEPAAEGDEVVELRRRVESLEQRLDLITRQLNELLQRREMK